MKIISFLNSKTVDGHNFIIKTFTFSCIKFGSVSESFLLNLDSNLISRLKIDTFFRTAPNRHNNMKSAISDTVNGKSRLKGFLPSSTTSSTHFRYGCVKLQGFSSPWKMVREIL